MTAKRYYAHKHLINEDKVHDKICHRFMNITETVEHMNMYYQKYTALKQENEQLKKQMQRLYNYFVDWHEDIMGANQFSEMWDNVKEDEDWEY